MRILSGLFLGLSAVALSGCVSDTYDRLTNLNTGCNASAFAVNCGSALTSTGTKPKPQTVTTSPDGTTTTTTTVNTGNSNTMTTGDTTLILEGSTVKSTVGQKPGLSKMSVSPLDVTIAKATDTSNVYHPEIYTADNKISFNTNTSSNGNWPAPKTMTFSDSGSCEYNGGAVIKSDGTADPTKAGLCVSGAGGTGLGGNYKLYRAMSAPNAKNPYDEELQVWTWANSYATQYRDVTASDTDPQHQAWSFGGNYTVPGALPTTGQVVYTGKFTATAKTANFVDTPRPTLYSQSGTGPTELSGKTVSRNNNWRVLGDSALTADFSAGSVNGVLTPKDWQGLDGSSGGLSDIDVDQAIADNTICYNETGACDPSTPSGAVRFSNWQNYSGFMSSPITLQTTIAKIPTALT